MATQKPLLIFNGNCQAQHLAAMIQSTGVADTAYAGPDWGFQPAYEGRICRVLHSAEEENVYTAARAAGRKLIQVSQMSPFRGKQSRGQPIIEAADKRVVFPELRLWAISPRRFAESFKSAFDVGRILEIDLQTMRLNQQGTGFPVDVAGFVEQEMVRRPLFHTVNHPVGAIFSRLLEGLSVLLAPEVDTKPFASLAAALELREGLNFETDHPVSKDVRDAAGFHWPESYAAYERMLHSTGQRRWRELESNRAEFEGLFSADTQYWRCYAELGIARNDRAVALPALEKLLELCPGVRAPWQLYVQFLHTNNRAEDAQALLARAENFFGDCGIWHGLAARTHLMFERLGEAEEHARAHWAASSENIHSVFPLLEVLLRQEKGEEARHLVASLAGRHRIALNILRGFLARKKATDLIAMLPPVAS